jgi:hypothetical protein
LQSKTLFQDSTCELELDICELEEWFETVKGLTHGDMKRISPDVKAASEEDYLEDEEQDDFKHNDETNLVIQNEPNVTYVSQFIKVLQIAEFNQLRSHTYLFISLVTFQSLH